MSYTAVGGRYVVNTMESWVYDIDIYFDKKKIAVVGFTPRQLDGALFWQIGYDDIIQGNYSQSKILEVAREYRDLYRPKAKSESE